MEKSVKTALSGAKDANVIIGTSHALEDFTCNDPICGTLEVIGSLSTGLGLVLGNIPMTKKYTPYTTSVTVCCRSVRAYCKNYGTYWGCVTSAAATAKKVVEWKLVK